MQRKKLSQLFAEVDPELKVINGGSYRHRHNKRLTRLGEKPAIEGYRYEPHTSTNEDWEKGAVTCPLCRQPTVRLLPYGFLGKRKVCPECIERRARLLERKARIFEARRRSQGRMTIEPEDWTCH